MIWFWFVKVNVPGLDRLGAQIDRAMQGAIERAIAAAWWQGLITGALTTAVIILVAWQLSRKY